MLVTVPYPTHQAWRILVNVCRLLAQPYPSSALAGQCVAATPNDAVDGIVEGAGLIAALIFLVVCLTRNPRAAACSRTAAWSSCSDFSK